MLKFTQFCNLKELQEKSVFLITAVQTFEAFLNIFLRF